MLYDRQRRSREAIGARDRGADGRDARCGPTMIPRIIAGQGTAGLEIVEQAKAQGLESRVALVPCGGGGLIAGCALAPDGRVSRHRDLRGRAGRPRRYAALARSRRTRRQCAGRHVDLRCAAAADAGRADVRGQPAAPGRRSHRERRRGAERDRVRVPSPEAGGRAGRGGRARGPGGKLALEGRTAVVVLSGGNVDPALFAAAITGAGRSARQPLSRRAPCDKKVDSRFVPLARNRSEADRSQPEVAPPEMTRA